MFTIFMENVIINILWRIQKSTVIMFWVTPKKRRWFFHKLALPKNYHFFLFFLTLSKPTWNFKFWPPKSNKKIRILNKTTYVCGSVVYQTHCNLLCYEIFVILYSQIVDIGQWWTLDERRHQRSRQNIICVRVSLIIIASFDINALAYCRILHYHYFAWIIIIVMMYWHCR